MKSRCSTYFPWLYKSHSKVGWRCSTWIGSSSHQTSSKSVQKRVRKCSQSVLLSADLVTQPGQSHWKQHKVAEVNGTYTPGRYERIWLKTLCVTSNVKFLPCKTDGRMNRQQLANWPAGWLDKCHWLQKIHVTLMVQQTNYKRTLTMSILSKLPGIGVRARALETWFFQMMARMYSILLARHRKLNTRRYMTIHSGVNTFKQQVQKNTFRCDSRYMTIHSGVNTFKQQVQDNTLRMWTASQ